MPAGYYGLIKLMNGEELITRVVEDDGEHVLSLHIRPLQDKLPLLPSIHPLHLQDILRELAQDILHDLPSCGGVDYAAIC